MKDLIFKPMEFINNLVYMGIGMLGIFIIIAVIMVATYLIGHFTAKKPKNKDKNDQQ